MGVTYKERPRPEDVSRLTLEVEVAGLLVTVKKGSFRADGKDYALTEDMEHEVVVDPSNLTSVLAYLVQLVDGTVNVLVDELVHDGIDRAYQFDDGSVRPLCSIYTIHHIPPGTTDLSTQAVQVDRTTPELKPTPPPALTLQGILNIARRGPVN